jgi:hypothetical protein
MVLVVLRLSVVCQALLMILLKLKRVYEVLQHRKGTGIGTCEGLAIRRVVEDCQRSSLFRDWSHYHGIR